MLACLAGKLKQQRADMLDLVQNVRQRLHSPALVPDDRFAVFLDIFGHEHSATAPITAIGSDYQGMFDELVQSWQAGQVQDLASALRQLDEEIDERVRAASAELGGAQAA